VSRTSTRTRRRRLLGVAVVVAGLLGATAPGMSATATAQSTGVTVNAAATKAAAASASAPLRVASYNVRCASCSGGGKNAGTWAQRRGAIVASIRSQHLDVLGVQEASQGRIHDSATGSKNLSQFDDLRARLGGTWKLTNSKRYNCVKDSTPTKCKYAAKGASRGTRILYDSARVQLLSAGSARLPKPASDEERSVAWAKFRQRSTGKTFMFANLHTISADKYYSYKKKQAEKAVATVKAHNPSHLPMIAVGDWNSSRFEDPTNAPYDAFRKAGFVDPLGGKYNSTKTAPGATVEKRIRTWVSSSNRYTRKAPAHKTWVNGSYIDYIMTTPMRVSEWETVARLDKSGNFVGRIPSDHNMIRATVWLPR
jgi:endonuclease/exonuclease/phosphatase family metal-dependent hydrolase